MLLVAAVMVAALQTVTWVSVWMEVLLLLLKPRLWPRTCCLAVAVLVLVELPPRLRRWHFHVLLLWPNDHRKLWSMLLLLLLLRKCRGRGWPGMLCLGVVEAIRGGPP